jgi:two-component system, chemotaxis family, CheB/CheR fusion protein
MRPAQPSDPQPSAEEQTDHSSLNLVGIGASAGGISALKEFFADVPSDAGLVFVVVMHLSPEYDSNLAEVLQPAVSFPVHKVDGRVRMERDHVYVIPQNRNLVVTDGHLEVTEFNQQSARRSVIDLFFRSLAETHPDGIGVLLSGTGTDGALGMRAIKEQGGLILAQDPKDAEYDEMPRSIIATGIVDFVLPARMLGAKVVQLRPRGAAVSLDSSPHLPEAAAEQLQRIMTQLKSRTGHDFSGYKKSTVLRRVGRRLRVTQAAGLGDYAELLRNSASEPTALLKDLLISVTSFFRDAATFEAWERTVVPALFAGASADDTLRVWVAGCATGEEAYSIAMLLHEHASRLPAPPAVQLFASDLDDDAVALAREGLYPAAIAEDVSAERLERFFRREGGYYRVSKDLREMILFATHNLLRDPPFSRLDLISCRNFLIYLEREQQERALDLFHYALREDGYLLLGSSESVDSASTRFRTVDRAHRVYQRRQGGRRQHGSGLSELPLPLPGARPAGRPRVAVNEVPRPSADAELHRAVFDSYAPPSILVDDAYTILHVDGAASRYLQYPSGIPSANLQKAARPELRVELRLALFQAFEKGRSTHTRPLPLQLDGEARAVQMHVSPVIDGEGSGLALIIFLESDAGTVQTGAVTDDTLAGHVESVEQELDILRQRLQQTVEEADTREEELHAANEELKAANEELQSINEEYKSTLEELETSREELQSTNEELKTVNDELKLKLDELARSNDDLRNLTAATDIGTLFIDRELNIKRFTPALRNIFNIMPVDEGRPLTDLTHRLDYDTFSEDCVSVLQTLQPLEHEAGTRDGLWFLVRITPYRTGDDRIAGVVATFTDITAVRAAQEDLRSSEERHRLLVEGVGEYAIYMMDADGNIKIWNRGAERIFGYDESDILGQPFQKLFTPQDRTARAHERELAQAREAGEVLNERWQLRRDGSQFWASGILTALYDEAGELRGFAKVLRDNTTRQQQEAALRHSEAQLRTLNETLEHRVAARAAELAQANARIRQLASEIVLAEQRVRVEIARRLHDELQQQLYGVQMKLATLRLQTVAGDAGTSEQIANVERSVGDALGLARGLAVDLSPPVLGSESLAEVLGWLADQMLQTHGLRVSVRDTGVGDVPSYDLRILVFQSVRELLFNVVKHADRPEARIEMQRTADGIVVEVCDDGPGFDAHTALRSSARAGFGLRSVRERLRLFSADLQIDSSPGHGTRIAVIAPYPAHSRTQDTKEV